MFNLKPGVGHYIGWLTLFTCLAPIGISGDMLRAQEESPSIYGLQFSPDGKWLAAATGSSRSQGGPVVMWSVATWVPRVIQHEPAGATDVDFSGDGRLLGFGTWANHAAVVDVASGQIIQTIRHPQGVPGVALTPDGRLLVTACHDGNIYVWDVQTGERQRTFAEHGDTANDVDVSPDGTLVVCCSNNGLAKLWELASGGVKYTSEREDSIVRRVDFSSDGNYFLMASWGGRARVGETATGRLRVQAAQAAICARLSPDNCWLALGSFGNAACVYRVDLEGPTDQQRQPIARLIDDFTSNDYKIREAASAELKTIGLPAERFLRRAIESPDAEVRIRARDVLRATRSAELVIKLEGHVDRVETVCFSPDGKLLATGCRGGRIKVWSVADFQEVTSLVPPRGTASPFDIVPKESD